MDDKRSLDSFEGHVEVRTASDRRRRVMEHLQGSSWLKDTTGARRRLKEIDEELGAIGRRARKGKILSFAESERVTKLAAQRLTLTENDSV